VNGTLVVNKPGGWTSHDVVRRVRGITGERSVGHLGTLDPMATGVLPLLLGKMTRLAQFYQHSEKVYAGTIRLGISTDTYDADGELGTENKVNCSLTDVRAAAASLTGMIEQIPPPYSAKKIKGVPAYKLARKNEPVELKPVRVHVKSFEIMDWDGKNETTVRFESVVGSGTYVRSLAHEMGKLIGCGAHLSSLVRTRSGDFMLDQAVSLEHLEAAMSDARLEDVLVSPQRMLTEYPSVVVTDDGASKVRHGNAINLPVFSPADMVRVFSHEGELMAIASKVAGTLYQPKVVLV